jgi:Ca-activated chloride channel family protein
MEQNTSANKQSRAATPLTLQARPERRYIRMESCDRAIDFHIQVGPAPVQDKPTRPPLNLILVLDRSGSMQGAKLRLAKRATLAVLDYLTERDSVAVVVFDDQIDVVQASGRVVPRFKKQVKDVLETIQARASTALHEGWLTGCKAIINDDIASRESEMKRCFLLTDGIANVGVTDPERIASEAAGIREHTGVTTSTFGIGEDYNELLLGPMAVAGGGQFHHLRSPDEIFNTFVGELGELLNVAARQVRLEIEVKNGVSIELISDYWMDTERLSIAIGDLPYDTEQHVVIRVHFPEQADQETHSVRARLIWVDNEGEHRAEWQELHFSYASTTTCDAEPYNQEAMLQVGLQQADRARREAIGHNNKRDLVGARDVLQKTAQQITAYALPNSPLQQEIAALNELEQQLAAAPLPPEEAKERYYQQHSKSHFRRDHR